MPKPRTGADPSYTLEGVDLTNASDAFREFFHHFFIEPTGLLRREVNLDFLHRLPPEEATHARALLRRNLHLRHTHLYEGLGEIGDEEAAEELRRLLREESDLKLRLAIGRALWRLRQDPVFREVLREMVRARFKGASTLKEEHIDDLWVLGDEETIQLLGELLGDRGAFVRSLAVGYLNGIEARTILFVASSGLPHDAAYYRQRLQDPAFVRALAENLRTPRSEWPRVLRRDQIP